MDPFSLTLSPEQFELAVAEVLRAVGAELTDVAVLSQERVDGVDGEYVIDATARFSAFGGASFLVLVECKSGAKPIERETLQVLREKILSTRAQKAILVATSHFQRGAVEYAEHHHISLVLLQDGSFNYIVKAEGAKAALRGGYAAALARIPPDGSDGVLYVNLVQGVSVPGVQLLLEAWGVELKTAATS